MAEIHRGKRQLPPRILLYGPEGIGKSTFAAEAGALILSTESGLDQIDCASVHCESFADIMQWVNKLTHDSQGFSAVCVDTLDWTERMIWQGICQRYNVANIDKAAGGYGKAYTEAVEQWWTPMLNGLKVLQQLGMTVILNGHAKIENFADPENPAYDRWTPALHKLSSPIVRQWADAVLFGTKRMRVAEDETAKNDRVIAAPVGKDGGDRILRCIGGPGCVAKNRYGLPETIPFSWQSLLDAMAKAQAK